MILRSISDADRVSACFILYKLLEDNKAQLDESAFFVIAQELPGRLSFIPQLDLLSRFTSAGYSNTRVGLVTHIQGACKYSPMVIFARLVNICQYFESLEKAIDRSQEDAEFLINKVASPNKGRGSEPEVSLYEKVDGITNASLAFLKQGTRTAVLVKEARKKFLKMKDDFHTSSEPLQDYYQLISDAVPEIKLILNNEFESTSNGLDKEEVFGIVNLAAKVFGLA